MSDTPDDDARTLRERTLPPPAGTRLRLVRGDLATMDVDAVVNAANEMLQHGGGLAAALVRAGGAEVQDESDAWVRSHGPVPTGKAALTGAGELPALWIIHAVGPVWRGGSHDEEGLLRSAVRESLALARAHRLDSIALPAISAGIFGYPKDACARVILDEITRFYREEPEGGPVDVRVALRDEDVIQAFLAAWDEGAGGA